METISILRSDSDYDRLLKEARENGLADYGDMSFVRKEKGTSRGNPIVMVTFTVDVDGERKRVTSSTTLKNFARAALLAVTDDPDELLALGGIPDIE